MAYSLWYIQPLKPEEWGKYYPPMRLLPQKISKKICGVLPAITLAELQFNLLSEKIRMCIIGLPEHRVPVNLRRKIAIKQPDLLFSAQELPQMTQTATRAGFETMVFPGDTVKAVLFFEAIKDYIKQTKILGSNPNILIWGADEGLGALLVYLCAREWNSIIAGGEDGSKLRKLGHSLLFDTGVSLRIWAPPARDIHGADLVILTKPFPRKVLQGHQRYREIFDRFADKNFGHIDISDNVKREGFELVGPQIADTLRAKSAYRFKWNFSLIEGLIFGMTLSGRGIYDFQVHRDFDELRKKLKHFGFRVLFNGNPGIMSIYS